jgi:predicted ribosome quality control (RQC) complex YloA/Tae2 family protein
MALKWKELEVLLEEAKPLLLGSSLQKIFQLKEQPDSYVFQGFGSGGGFRFWLSLTQDHSVFVRAQEEWRFEASTEPSTAVMVLRKWVLGKTITGLESWPGERLAFIHFPDCVLVLELLPRKANFILGLDWRPEDRSLRVLQSHRSLSLEAGGRYTLPKPPQAAAPEVREFERTKNSAFTLNSAIGHEAWTALANRGFEGLKRLWRQQWKSHQRKLKSALDSAEQDLARSDEAQALQKKGQALIAILFQLGPKNFPKETKLKLEDGLELSLDRSKTFAENAEQYFKKSKKLGRANEELVPRVNLLKEKLASWIEFGKKVEAAPEERELEVLGRYWEQEGLPIPEIEEDEDGPEEAKPFLSLVSGDGFRILCGRNQEENRSVTFREAKGNDIWMHLKGAPGAHVVIKQIRGKTVPLSTLLEAGQICLLHSKVRKGRKAEVDYTSRKNVRAIKGTLSEVTYTANKTLLLELDQELLKRVLGR